MDSAAPSLLLTACLTILAAVISLALPGNAANIRPTFQSSAAGASCQISFNSVVVALLDSHYTELAELVEKAFLLDVLEDAIGRHNLTIFAPRNEALERDLDPEFKRFLLEPRNLKSLQILILYHVIPSRITSSSDSWASGPVDQRTLSGDHLRLSVDGVAASKRVETTVVIHPDAVVRPDGVIHGIEQLLVPKSVQDDFNRRRTLASIAAVLPASAPAVDSRTNRLFPSKLDSPSGTPAFSVAVWAPALAPAPAPGPASTGVQVFDGESEVKDFIDALIEYGGYSELADMLVNLTSLATEMGRLVSEGYVLTVLAPNDEAMGKLTAEQLSEPGAPERIVYYHLIPEYQTEESMYNAVRRFGKVRYDTLRVPHKVVVREADGSVRFGQGYGSAYLFDPDIYTDGRISVQGIDSVLFPPEKVDAAASPVPAVAPAAAATVVNPRRGKLLEVACQMLSVLGQSSRFATCR